MSDRKDREAEVAALGRDPEFLGRVIEAVAPCARCNHGQRSHTTNLPRCLGEPGGPPCPCVGYVYPTVDTSGQPCTHPGLPFTFTVDSCVKCEGTGIVGGKRPEPEPADPVEMLARYILNGNQAEGRMDYCRMRAEHLLAYIRDSGYDVIRPVRLFGND